jgi:ferredoxin
MMTRLFKWRWFPEIIQYPIIAFCILLLYFALVPESPPGISEYSPDDYDGLVKGKYLVFTNLATFVTWVIFKPGFLVLMSFLFGAIWCMICPARGVMNLFHRFNLGIKYPFFLQNFALLVALFFMHRVLVEYYGLHWDPRNTAIYVIVLFALPIIWGLLFRGRPYCKYVCPLRLVVGFYSLCTALIYKVKNEKVCQNCETEPCRVASDGSNEHPCPNLLNPVRINTNKECLLCLACLKNCPENNIGFERGKPLEGLLGDRPWTPGEILVVGIILGIIMEVSLKSQPQVSSFLYWPAHQIKAMFGPEPHLLKAIVAGLWTYIIVPGVLIMLPAFIHRMTGQTKNAWRAVGNYARFFVPIAFIGHLAFGLKKANLFLSYGTGTLADPYGIKSAMAIKGGFSIPPVHLLPPFAFKILIFIIVCLAVGASWWVIWKTGKLRGKDARWSIPIAIGCLIPATLFIFGFLA